MWAAIRALRRAGEQFRVAWQLYLTLAALGLLPSALVVSTWIKGAEWDIVLVYVMAAIAYLFAVFGQGRELIEVLIEKLRPSVTIVHDANCPTCVQELPDRRILRMGLLNRRRPAIANINISVRFEPDLKHVGDQPLQRLPGENELEHATSHRDHVDLMVGTWSGPTERIGIQVHLGGHTGPLILEPREYLLFVAARGRDVIESRATFRLVHDAQGRPSLLPEKARGPARP